MRWNLSSTYLELPELFYTSQPPGAVARPSLVVFNDELSGVLGLGRVAEGDVAILGGNAVVEGSSPFAQAYAGHQYGHFTMLGDGRALVLGEQITPEGLRYDVQLKGSGPTPYSRNGDGRAALGPMLREYLIGEALNGLGIPSSRALAVVATGETVWRETGLSGAVLTRVASSHLRVGTFEYAAATGDEAALLELTHYALTRHFPDADTRRPGLALLEAVVKAQAKLVALWMSVGFVHGVMNTDNMSISGQSLDFGPCAFLDAYRSRQVFSSIDQRGRYAYGNQPGIARWNLTRLAEALLPLIHENQERAIAEAQAVIDGFGPQYEAFYGSTMAAKLGLTRVRTEDARLVDDLLVWMEAAGRDYTSSFRTLSDDSRAVASLREDPVFDAWYLRWQALSPDVDLMARVNPVYLARNHRVEAALTAAVAGDFEPFHTLVNLVKAPFVRRPGFEAYEGAPGPDSSHEPYVTYCGT